jgi:hypothetical protein
MGGRVAFGGIHDVNTFCSSFLCTSLLVRKPPVTLNLFQEGTLATPFLNTVPRGPHCAIATTQLTG